LDVVNPEPEFELVAVAEEIAVDASSVFVDGSVTEVLLEIVKLLAALV